MLSQWLSPANLVSGAALGALYGIVGVGLVLIYRTTRVINFAAAAVGAVPAVVALLMDIAWGVNYLVALPVAMVGGLAFGALTDLLVMRRFARAPRLIVTVVTIGVAQGLAALGFFVPVWFGVQGGQIPQVPTPWQSAAVHNGRGEPIVTGNQAFAFVVVLSCCIALVVFLRFTRLGIALRAAAENGERAALLGIPVLRIGTVAWAAAGLLSALAVFAQAPLIGVPSDATLGFDTLLYGLTAAVVAKMDRIGVALGTGMAIGVVIYASVASTGTNDIASALMVVIILVALLLQRRSLSRAADTGVSTWQTVQVFRPIPAELRDLREVAVARAMMRGAAVLLAVGMPFVVGTPNLPALTVLPLYGIVAVSLVILTGWAGQVSLGQFGFVGIGAAVAGGLAADHNVDFFVALAVGVAAGAAAAVVTGLPASRIQGLYLAVTTLGFGYAMQNYVLNRRYAVGRLLLPSGYDAHLVRPRLYGMVDLENGRVFYFVCLGLFVLAFALAAAYRRNRCGRVLIALRDNQRAAQSLAVDPVRTRLAAFAVSGGLAGLAGTLFAYLQHNVIPGSYGVTASIAVFLAAAIGGLTSLWPAVVGVIAFKAAVLFGPDAYQRFGATVTAVVPLLLTGPLLVLSLYMTPGGLAQWAYDRRDDLLRRLAHRHRITVPSLVAAVSAP